MQQRQATCQKKNENNDSEDDPGPWKRMEAKIKRMQEMLNKELEELKNKYLEEINNKQR